MIYPMNLSKNIIFIYLYFNCKLFNLILIIHWYFILIGKLTNIYLFIYLFIYNIVYLFIHLNKYIDNLFENKL